MDKEHLEAAKHGVNDLSRALSLLYIYIPQHTQRIQYHIIYDICFPLSLSLSLSVSFCFFLSLSVSFSFCLCLCVCPSVLLPVCLRAAGWLAVCRSVGLSLSLCLSPSLCSTCNPSWSGFKRHVLPSPMPSPTQEVQPPTAQELRRSPCWHIGRSTVKDSQAKSLSMQAQSKVQLPAPSFIAILVTIDQLSGLLDDSGCHFCQGSCSKLFADAKDRWKIDGATMKARLSLGREKWAVNPFALWTSLNGSATWVTWVWIRDDSRNCAIFTKPTYDLVGVLPVHFGKQWLVIASLIDIRNSRWYSPIGFDISYICAYSKTPDSTHRNYWRHEWPRKSEVNIIYNNNLEEACVLLIWRPLQDWKRIVAILSNM